MCLLYLHRGSYPSRSRAIGRGPCPEAAHCERHPYRHGLHDVTVSSSQPPYSNTHEIIGPLTVLSMQTRNLRGWAVPVSSFFLLQFFVTIHFILTKLYAPSEIIHSIHCRSGYKDTKATSGHPLLLRYLDRLFEEDLSIVVKDYCGEMIMRAQINGST